MRNSSKLKRVQTLPRISGEGGELSGVAWDWWMFVVRFWGKLRGWWHFKVRDFRDCWDSVLRDW